MVRRSHDMLEFAGEVAFHQGKRLKKGVEMR